MFVKKVLFAALVFQFLVFARIAPGLGADERREFISKTMNANVQKLLENCHREMIGQESFSSKNNNIVDSMIGFYDTDHGLLVMLHALSQRLDEQGRAIPDIYNGEPVAIVFVDKSLLWYKSEVAKRTLKAKMAGLIRNRSI